MLNIVGSEVPKKVKEILSRKDNESIIIVRSEKFNDLLFLNPVAAYIFERCNGKYNIREIVDSICRDFEETRKEELVVDTIKIIRKMQKLGILESKGGEKDEVY